jgi:hypothetical protein
MIFELKSRVVLKNSMIFIQAKLVRALEYLVDGDQVVACIVLAI